ncbi:MAG TPA: GNAT family N-acetyltransferase [Chthoniobacterales bacterium]|nr:GNAT family N-acetyltransferase [Chthoniobacterales bacterium]
MMTLLELDRAIEGSETTLIVAVEKNELIGSVEIRLGQLVAGIRALNVVQHHRRKGLGWTLLQRCLEIATNHGCESIGLTCWRSNTAAVALYRRGGFIVTAEQGHELELIKPLR